jgi:hypothetical protein
LQLSIGLADGVLTHDLDFSDILAATQGSKPSVVQKNPSSTASSISQSTKSDKMKTSTNGRLRHAPSFVKVAVEISADIGGYADATVEGASMSALIIRLPEEKRTRLKLVAKSRKVSVTKLIEEMATILLADFDAETRFELRAARGRGRIAEGLALLDKAAGKRARSKRN